MTFAETVGVFGLGMMTGAAIVWFMEGPFRRWLRRRAEALNDESDE